jgi:hypothetical protein
VCNNLKLNTVFHKPASHSSDRLLVIFSAPPLQIIIINLKKLNILYNGKTGTQCNGAEDVITENKFRDASSSIRTTVCVW